MKLAAAFALATCALAQTCTDLVPSTWQDTDGNNCSSYVDLQFCTPSGHYGEGWIHAAAGFESEGWTVDQGQQGASAVCCGCGAGVCKDQDWVDSRGYSCYIYEKEGLCSSGAATSDLSAYAVDNVSAADACCSCGGGCQSNETWRDTLGNNCSSYFWSGWCSWTGGLGPGWNSSWGSLEDYAVNDISAWDACCECQRCPREVILMDQAELDSYAALGCQRAHRILSVRAGDFSQLKLRTVNYLGLESVTAQNLTGFDNTVVEQGFALIGSEATPVSLHGLYKFYRNLSYVDIRHTGIRDLSQLPPVEIVGILTLWTNSNLVSMAGLSSVREVGWMEIRANPMLKSLHGLENLNTATDSSAQGRSVSITGNAQLCSLDALGSLRGDVPHRIRLELSTVPMANLSLQGLLGLTRICSSNTCTSDSLRIFATNAGGEISEFLCLPESDRSLLQDMMPPSTPLLNATFNGCTSCARDCGYLPSGYRIACDYSVGLCGCPLGTGGPNCSLPSPEVRIVPGQSKECMRPRLVEGNTKICEVCIQVQTNNYDTALLDPPQTVRVVPADSTLAFEWPQRISWQTPTEGQLCVDMTLPASDPPTGVETFELMLTYSDRTQDFFLPGSLREPLLYSVGPMYPWCLDSGDCFRSGNDTTSFVLTVTEPPTGSAEFQTQEIQVTEGAADVAVVVFRGGGDYGTLTSIIGVDENSSTAVPGLQYTWADEIISWPHGDSTPKAFTMSFPDDDVYQPPRNLTLTFVTQDSIRMVSTTLVINDDGDAGMLGFSSQRYETLEGSAGSGCLLYARREGGSSGRAAAKVEVVPCDSGEASATENDDYILAAGSLTWEDEVTGEQCAVTLSDIAQASGGTVAGPARLVLFQDAETEGDESICFGLTKLPDSVSEVTAADRSTFSSRSALVLQDEGPSGGPPQDNCVRGRPCTVDLSQSDLVRFVADRVWSGRRLSSGGEVTVALALRSCATCAAPTAATAPMLLSRNYTAQWPEVTVDPGRYLMCLCPCSTGACFGRPVASLTLDGMRGGQQATCFLGQPCELANVQGVGLGAGDALTAAESCGETELLSGLPGSRVASDITNSGIYSFDSAGILSSSSGVFSLCWCRGGATACTDKEDFQQQVGLFKASGPQQGSRVQCMLNSTCVLPGLTGTGLQSGDKLMALESCGSAASVEWGAEFPVATTLDGANYSFGHLSVSSGSVLRELDLCWCPAGAQCQSPPDFRVLAGKLQLLCPRGFFWPTDEGVPEREGKCQACMSYQTTIQVGAIGDAACVCQTDLAFQEVTDGNCGCRDGYHWSGATRSCEPCNSGQSCQWENLFQYSLGLPPLVPGFWSTPEGSVYRCFSDRTCPNTNSVCAYGRAGKACSLCAPGYVGGHDGECTPYSESCAHSNSDANLAAFIPLAALVALTAAGCCLIAVAMRGRSANKQTYVSSTYLSAWKTSLAQNFQYLQLLSIVSLFEVRWPTVLAEIWRLIRSITMDLVTLPSLGCLMEVPSAFGEMLVRFLVPVVLASLTFVAWGLLLLLRKSLRFAPGKFAESLQELITVSGAQVLELLMLVGTLFFSVLVRNGFILFTCARGPNQVSTVVIYPHIDCPSIFALGDLELWFELMPYALAYNVVFSFGLIFGVWYSARKTVQFLVQNDFAERGSWAFLSWEFRDTYTWWLLVKMSRDLLINVLAAAFTNMGSVQLLSTAVVSMVYAYWCEHSHPFKDPLNNMLESWCSISLGVICFFAAGMGFAFDSDNDYSRAYLEEGGPETDTTYRDQILLFFQLVSFGGAVLILVVQLLLLIFPGLRHRAPRRFRRSTKEELEESVNQLRVAFEAADVKQFDDIEVTRNLKILHESPATLGTDSHSTSEIQRGRSGISVMPGRRYMAKVSKQNSARSLKSSSTSSLRTKNEEAAKSKENLNRQPSADMSSATPQSPGEESVMSPLRSDDSQMALTHDRNYNDMGSPIMSPVGPSRSDGTYEGHLITDEPDGTQSVEVDEDGYTRHVF